MILITKVLLFLFLKGTILKLKKKNICINVFCYEINLTYPVYVPNEKFKNCTDLLLISDKNKSQCVSIKDFNRFMCNKTKKKNEKNFCKCCLQCFSSENVLINDKKKCLIINGKQSVTLKAGSIECKDHFKQ